MGKLFQSQVVLAGFAAVLSLSQVGCQADEAKPREEKSRRVTTEKIENVARIFLNSGSYTLLVQDPATGEMRLGYVSCYTNACFRNLRFIPDVPAGQPMFAVMTMEEEDGRRHVADLAFHVHSAADVGGGTWDHGKNGHGNIHVIE